MPIFSLLHTRGLACRSVMNLLWRKPAATAHACHSWTDVSTLTQAAEMMAWMAAASPLGAQAP